jgi:hypothetical protein
VDAIDGGSLGQIKSESGWEESRMVVVRDKNLETEMHGGGGGLHASDNGRDDDRPTEQVKGDSDKCSVFKELQTVMG